MRNKIMEQMSGMSVIPVVNVIEAPIPCKIKMKSEKHNITTAAESKRTEEHRLELLRALDATE